MIAPVRILILTFWCYAACMDSVMDYYWKILRVTDAETESDHDVVWGPWSVASPPSMVGRRERRR